jgi:hypothetical protein
MAVASIINYQSPHRCLHSRNTNQTSQRKKKMGEDVKQQRQQAVAASSKYKITKAPCQTSAGLLIFVPAGFRLEPCA